MTKREGGKKTKKQHNKGKAQLDIKSNHLLVRLCVKVLMLLIKSWRKGTSESSGSVVLRCGNGGKTRRHLLNTAEARFSVSPRGQLQLGIMGPGETGA